MDEEQTYDPDASIYTGKMEQPGLVDYQSQEQDPMLEDVGLLETQDVVPFLDPFTDPLFLANEMGAMDMMPMAGSAPWLPLDAWMESVRNIKFSLLRAEFKGDAYLGIKNKGPIPVAMGSVKWAVKIKSTTIISGKTQAFNIGPFQQGKVKSSFKLSGKGLLKAIWSFITQGKAPFRAYGTLNVTGLTKSFDSTKEIKW